MAAGWKLLSRLDDDASPSALRAANNSYLSGRAFFPLTLPLTVGPGSISVAIAVGANRPAASAADGSLPVAALLGCTAIGLMIYLSYYFAEPIGRFLGETAMSIFIRLSSFILLCIGVQIVWNGLSMLLSSIS
jgi:multiple antibiotic resistance protein